MNKWLIGFLVKNFILYVLVFLAFFVLRFVLQRIKVRQEQDRKNLMFLFYTGSIVTISLIMYYVSAGFSVNEIVLFFIFIFSVVFAYLLFVVFLLKPVLKYLLIFNSGIDQGQIVEYEQSIFKFLGFYKTQALLEDIDGNVQTLPVGKIFNSVKAVQDTVCFPLNAIEQTEQVRQLLERNPYIEPEKLAVIEEEDLATRQKFLKICIKGKVSFKQIKQLKSFLSSVN